MASKGEYKREFFGRSYSAGDAYRRVWKYARRYWFRLFVGIVCGMLTAGTLVPVFQIVQPALQHVESHDSQVEAAASMEAASGAEVSDMAGERPVAAKPKNSFEKEIAKHSKLPDGIHRSRDWRRNAAYACKMRRGVWAARLR